MRPDEPKSFDPHTPIDPHDPTQIDTLAEALEVSPDDVREAVDRVGTNPTAVAIWLG